MSLIGAQHMYIKKMHLFTFQRAQHFWQSPINLSLESFLKVQQFINLEEINVPFFLD